MIKLFTLNSNPDGPCITPKAGARTLTVSRPVARWSTMPPEIYGGSMECAAYDELSDLLAAHGCADLPALMRQRPGDRCVAIENVIIDGSVGKGPGVIKLTSLFRRPASMSRAAFMAHYPNNHAPLVRKTPELPRYVQNYALEETVDLPQSFDAVAELWWPDREMAIRSWSSDAVQVDQAKDCEIFIARGVTLFGDERYVVDNR
jgi:uncharacterized protein (TIGR02118 family)